MVMVPARRLESDEFGKNMSKQVAGSGKCSRRSFEDFKANIFGSPSPSP